MAAVSLFWDTNMAAMTSCEKTQYQQRVKIAGDLSKKTIAIENFFRSNSFSLHLGRIKTDVFFLSQNSMEE